MTSTTTFSIEAHGLTKRYGAKTAVDNLSFGVAPGKVTGFLGPNGAGKSTTMRLLLGLERPDAGTALINRKPYASLTAPLSQVGALLRPRRSTRAAPPATTCCAWRSRRPCRSRGWTR
jgi:ABC-2 type transport system ATP-binding protein